MSAPDPASAGPEPCRKCGHYRGAASAEKGCKCGCGCTPAPTREPEGEEKLARDVVELWENAFGNCPHYPGSGTRACECKVCLEEMVSRLLREAKIAERERCARIVEDWCSAENPLSAELRERKG